VRSKLSCGFFSSDSPIFFYLLFFPASLIRKHAVETTETLDFLKELVQGVPDPSAGGTIDLEAEMAENKKKRGKGKRAPTDPNAPKRRRKKKGDLDPNLMVFDKALPTTGSSGRVSSVKTPPEEQDDDAEMQDDPDEYDEEEEPRPAVGGSSSYRPRSPSEEDDWQGNKPFMPGRK
jgi:Dr1-associated corepressor